MMKTAVIPRAGSELAMRNPERLDEVWQHH